MADRDASTPNPESRIPNSHDSADSVGSPTFEQGASRIDEIVRLLERGDAPLDKSLALFEEGAKLIKVCGKMLDEAEQKVVFLQKGANGEPEVRPFNDEL